MNLKKKFRCLALSASLMAITTVLFAPSGAFAHSGGTDSSGCHAGSQPYHCHSGSSYNSYKVPSYNYSPTPNYNPYKVPSYNYTPPTIKPYKVPSYNYTPPTIKPYKVPSYKSSGPTALCGDYTFSYSKSRSGACAGHRGVLVWAG